MAEWRGPATRLRLAVALIVVVGALTVEDAVAVAQPPGGIAGNRLPNPGAEAGSVMSWSGAGFRAAAYGEDVAVPTPEFAQSKNYGAALFVAELAGAAIMQQIDVSDRAGDVDSGSQRFVLGGAFGGQGNRDDSTRVVLQAFGALGEAIGTPRIVGGPTAADRQGQTTLLACGMRGVLPAGTRTARVTLEATGSAGGGSADGLFFTTDDIPPQPNTAASPSAVAGGCAGAPNVGFLPPLPPFAHLPPGQPSPGVTPPGSRVPRLATLVSMPSRSRCRRERSLAVRVRPPWRRRVARLTARARDHSTSVAAPRLNRAIRVRAPRRSLRVRLSVRLSDGRTRAGTMRYRSCARRAP